MNLLQQQRIHIAQTIRKLKSPDEIIEYLTGKLEWIKANREFL